MNKRGANPLEKIQSENEYDSILHSEHTTVIYFYANWCPDCHRIEPFLPEVAEAFASKLKMYKIDRDELLELCQKLDIFGIPSFVGFKNGKEITRLVSRLGKTRAEIEHYLTTTGQVADHL